ncbi:MAG: VWA domain-containing protein [Dorea sp.]|nr:VWA domain-containing protein [Dorea sp.]
MGKKISITFLVLCLLLVGVPSCAMAAEVGQDGIKVTTSSDKAVYQEDEQPEFMVFITNSNKYEVNNVKVENALPGDFSFVDESKADQEIGSLKAGETVEVAFRMTHVEIENDGIDIGEEGEEKSPDKTDQKSNEDKKSDDNSRKDNNLNNDKKNTVETGDIDNVIIYGIIVLVASAVIIGILLKKKQEKRFLTVILCLGISGSFLNVTDALGAENNMQKQLFISTAISYNNIEYEVGTAVHYEIPEREVDQADLNAGILVDTVFNKKGTETLTFEYSDQKLPVTEVSVDYMLADGTGVVTAEDVTRYSYLSMVAGAVSAPVNFHVYEDTLESAVITFKYAPALLGKIDENALKIAWYDEVNQEVVLLEDSVVNTEANTISVAMEHFSQYIVIDTNEWYEKWAVEQLVIRDGEGIQTPYYNIIFALDGSGSMAGSNEQLCEDATIEFIRQLKGDDKISVMSFDDSATVHIENTILNDINMPEIEEKIHQINSTGGTDYQTALNTALSLIISGRENEDEENIKSRQSLLIFLSDGEPTTNYSEDTLEQLRYLSETAGCRAVTIGLGSGVNETYLLEIAEVGQGEYFHVSTPSKLADVFDTINSWYIGSTLDTDGDGLPDIVETTGMRTQFGEFIRTDPNNSDTDGDGISDGKEMGTFIYRDNGKSEFKISSNPTIPTYQSSESKIVVEKIALEPVKPSNEQLKSMSFSDLYDIFCNYQATLCARAELLEVATDYLSETQYQNAQPQVNFKFNVSCADPREGNKDIGEVSAGTRFFCEAKTVCRNNTLGCKEDHNQIIFAVDNNNGFVDISEIQKERLSAEERWKKLLEQKKVMLQSDFNNAQKQMKEKTSTFLDMTQKVKTKAEDRTLKEVQKKVETNIGIPDNVPNDLKVGFLNCFNEYIKNELVTHISSYKNVKTSADLVNKIFKEIETSDKTLKFTTPKGIPCTFTYKKVGAWGATFFCGTLTNNKSNASYPIGGTHVKSEEIQTEMIYLKEYADLKIDEAKDAIISDTKDLLKINELKSFLKDAIKNNIFEMLDEVSPMFSKKAEKLYEETEKFIEVEKEYKDITDIDFIDTDYDKLTKKIEDYTKSLNSWYNLITNL